MHTYIAICLVWAIFGSIVQLKKHGANWRLPFAFILNFILMPIAVVMGAACTIDVVVKAKARK